MDPITAGIIAGGVGVAGSALSNVFQSGEADENRDFQERMSSTAHQREIEDLRKAGINPMLTALGSGSSTPGGATASVNDLGPGISKGMETAIAVKGMNADLNLKDAQTDLAHDEGGLKAAMESETRTNARNTQEDTKAKVLQNKIIEATMSSAIRKAKAEGDYSEVNQIMNIINSGANSAGQLMNPFKGLINIPGKKSK